MRRSLQSDKKAEEAPASPGIAELPHRPPVPSLFKEFEDPDDFFRRWGQKSFDPAADSPSFCKEFHAAYEWLYNRIPQQASWKLVDAAKASCLATQKAKRGEVLDLIIPYRTPDLHDKKYIVFYWPRANDDPVVRFDVKIPPALPCAPDSILAVENYIHDLKRARRELERLEAEERKKQLELKTIKAAPSPSNLRRPSPRPSQGMTPQRSGITAQRSGVSVQRSGLTASGSTRGDRTSGASPRPSETTSSKTQTSSRSTLSPTVTRKEPSTATARTRKGLNAAPNKSSDQATQGKKEEGGEVPEAEAAKPSDAKPSEAKPLEAKPSEAKPPRKPEASKKFDGIKSKSREMWTPAWTKMASSSSSKGRLVSPTPSTSRLNTKGDKIDPGMSDQHSTSTLSHAASPASLARPKASALPKAAASKTLKTTGSATLKAGPTKVPGSPLAAAAPSPRSGKTTEGLAAQLSEKLRQESISRVKQAVTGASPAAH